MNYVDPMAARFQFRPGDYIMQGASQIAQLFQTLPAAIKQDMQTRDNLSFKQDLYDTAMEGLRKIGVDPMTVKLPNFSDENITKEQYTEMLGNALAPYVSGQGKRLTADIFNSMGMSQNQNVQTELQRQSLLNQNDPIGQIDLNSNNRINTVPPSELDPNNVVTNSEGQQMTVGASSQVDPMAGTGIDWSSGKLNVAPESKPINADGLLSDIKPFLVEALRNKEISPQKFSEQIMALKLEEKKQEREDKKRQAELERLKNEKIFDRIAAARGEASISEDGKETTDLNYSELYNDPSRFSVSTRNYPKEFAPGKGGGSGSGQRDRPTASWIQYKDVEAQLARLRSGKDDMGNPVKFYQNEYNNKQYEAATQLFAHNLEVNGMDYQAAQSTAQKVLDTNVIIGPDRSKEVISDGEGNIIALNLSHPKTMEALVKFAARGATATDLLSSLKRLKGLNPSRQW